MALWFTVLVNLVFLFHPTLAFDVVVINNGPNPVYPMVQAFGTTGEAADSVEGWLNPGEQRVYDNGNVFLNTPAINVKEGESRTMAILDNGVTYHSCGTVTFQGGTILTYENDECIETAMQQVTDVSALRHTGPTTKYSWIVIDFNPNTRDYATGPTTHVWSGAKKKSIIHVQAVNHDTGAYADIVVTGQKTTWCYWVQMNDAVTCGGQTGSYDLYLQYDASETGSLPAGSYSGVMRIEGEHWYDAGTDPPMYVNLEVTA